MIRWIAVGLALTFWPVVPRPAQGADLQQLLEQLEAVPDMAVLADDGALEFYGTIDEASSARWRAALKKLAATKPKEIVIRINSPGGDFDETQTIAQDLEKAAAHSVVACVVDGAAYSGAFYLLQSCTVRKMTKRSSLMAHEPYYAQLQTANRARLEEALEHIRIMSSTYVEHCAARLSLKEGEFAKRIKGKDWWMLPADALKVGAIDEVVPSPNSALKPAASLRRVEGPVKSKPKA